MVYALIFPCRLSPSSVMSIALLQQATNRLSLSIGEYGMHSTSMKSLCLQAKWLYDAISYQSKMSNGPMSYPSRSSSSEGMKISFRWASCYKCGDVLTLMHMIQTDKYRFGTRNAVTMLLTMSPWILLPVNLSLLSVSMAAGNRHS